MSTDPSAFLSTIAGSSAGLVAIIGGFLVNRFVSLDSEQQGAQRVLDDADARLAIARQRAEDAANEWLQHEARGFLYDWQIVETINNGETDLTTLRRLGDSTSLTDEELVPFVQEIRDELTLARNILDDRIPAAEDSEEVEAAGWDDFRQRTPGLPETDWNIVWETVFDQICKHRAEAREAARKAAEDAQDFLDPVGRRLAALHRQPRIPFIPGLAAVRTDWTPIDERRRDESHTATERAKQHVEDLEGEAQRLRRARDTIVRPRGLMRGLVVLAFFTVVGVVAPIAYLIPGGLEITPTAGGWVFAGFGAGLGILLLYMVDLALRLSPGRRSLTDWVQLASRAVSTKVRGAVRALQSRRQSHRRSQESPVACDFLLLAAIVRAARLRPRR